MLIGHKTKLKKSEKPQVVIERYRGANDFALLTNNEANELTLSWIGDPNAATKFDSKYAAKERTRNIADIPDSRAFKQLEG